MEKLQHLRIHTDVINNDIEKFVTFLRSKSETHLVVKELGSKNKREHLHCVFISNKTVSTFRQQLIKEYPGIAGKQNGAYSLAAVKDYNSMLQYCCKGEDGNKPCVMYSKDDINTDNLYVKYWEVNASLKKTEVNMGCQNGSSVLKAKSKSWTEKVYEEIRTDFEVECNTIITFTMDTHPSDLLRQQYIDSKKTIFRHMMRCLGKSAKKINENIVGDLFRGFINGIVQSDTEAGNAYSDRLFNNLKL